MVLQPHVPPKMVWVHSADACQCVGNNWKREEEERAARPAGRTTRVSQSLVGKCKQAWLRSEASGCPGGGKGCHRPAFARTDMRLQRSEKPQPVKAPTIRTLSLPA